VKTVVSVYLETKNVYGGLVSIPEGSRLVGRPTQTWEDNIKMSLRETGCASAD
jgi:hypothetical protein